jgi:hypothetical protein
MRNRRNTAIDSVGQRNRRCLFTSGQREAFFSSALNFRCSAIAAGSARREGVAHPAASVAH